jgi:hypothetical protein
MILEALMFLDLGPFVQHGPRGHCPIVAIFVEYFITYPIACSEWITSKQ